MDNLSIKIPGKPEYLTMVRLSIGSIAKTAGFDLDDIEDIKNAVEEACKHVSCHGFDKHADQYEVACAVENGRMEITVRDDCDQHTLEKMTKPCRNCPNEGNLAIYVIETLMDEVKIGKRENGCKEIKMVKTL